jgi:hypothetical protein
LVVEKFEPLPSHTHLDRKSLACTIGDFVHVDLNPITDFGSTVPETLAYAVLGVRHALRQILIARRTVH